MVDRVQKVVAVCAIIVTALTRGASGTVQKSPQQSRAGMAQVMLY
ncbi:MAG: hypothetical protein AB9866_17120 [Syntrophobacteraceae bacterium]